MAELRLKRFPTVSKYEANRVDIEDGDFFIIDETEQLGTNYRGSIFLTPSNILHGYSLPEGEVIITSRDSISKAIGKLEKHVNNTDLNVGEAIVKSEDAYAAFEEIKNLPIDDSDAALSARISALEQRDIVISEEEFSALEAAGKVLEDKIYYIYE